MKTTKEFNVVMLATEKASQIISIHQGKFAGQLANREHYGQAMTKMDDKYQHLYIISNDEIKDGDWVIHKLDKSPIQITKEILEMSDDKNISKYGYKKIVATTDKSLKIEGKCWCMKPERDGCMECNKQLPQISESFIQDYIKSYNEGKVIENVSLEMENKVVGYKLGHLGDEDIWDKVIKTNPDNTVIVHQNKMYTQEEYNKLLEKIGQMSLEMYTRDEVIDIITKLDDDGGISFPSLKLKQWIKDNL